MRCSVCDREESRFVYGNDHCFTCEEEIGKTIGLLEPDDLEYILLDDDEDTMIIDNRPEET